MRIVLEILGWVALVQGAGSFISRQFGGKDWFLMNLLSDFQPTANIVVAVLGLVLLVVSFSMKSKSAVDAGR